MHKKKNKKKEIRKEEDIKQTEKAANNTKNIKSEENESKLREMLVHTALKSSVNSLFGRLWFVSRSGIFIP